MRSKLLYLMAALLVTSLSAGCSHTAEGAGEDIEHGGQSIQDKAAKSRQAD